MRLAFLLAAILVTSGSVMADAVRITSPNHPQTFSYGEVIWRQLYVDTAGQLAARITFSNSLTRATTSRAGTKRSTFTFQVSDWILNEAPSLPGAATVNSFRSHGFAKVWHVAGLIWLVVRKFIC